MRLLHVRLLFHVGLHNLLRLYQKTDNPVIMLCNNCDNQVWINVLMSYVYVL